MINLMDLCKQPETALSVYHQMLRIRVVEEEIANRYSEWEMRCPVHLCIGQEAVPAGISAWLGDEDLVFSSHRSHGHYLAKGGNLNAFVAELYGRVTGCARGKGGSQHLVDIECGFMGSAPILASTMAVGVGAAWAKKRKKQDGLVVVYFGDGATEEGTFHEAMHFASLHSAPVLFVCENNLYSVQAPLSVRQSASRTIADLARAHGIAAQCVDGNDAEAVYAHSGEAVEYIRAANGPYLLEFETYRLKEHVGPNNDLDLGYRSHDEWTAWNERCPVDKLSEDLLRAGIVDADGLVQIRADVDVEVEAAFAFAQSSPFPEVEELFDHVYPTSEGS